MTVDELRKDIESRVLRWESVEPLLAALDVVAAARRDGPASLNRELEAFDTALAGRKEGT